MKKILISLAFIIVTSTSIAQNRIELTIENISIDNGDIMVALYNNKSDYMKNSYRETKAVSTNNEITIYFENIPNGNYAIALFQDVDKNKNLSKGMFGPKEPYGFSNNAKGSFGPAKFSDAKFEVKNKNVKLTIKID